MVGRGDTRPRFAVTDFRTFVRDIWFLPVCCRFTRHDPPPPFHTDVVHFPCFFGADAIPCCLTFPTLPSRITAYSCQQRLIAVSSPHSCRWVTGPFPVDCNCSPIDCTALSVRVTGAHGTFAACCVYAPFHLQSLAGGFLLRDYTLLYHRIPVIPDCSSAVPDRILRVPLLQFPRTNPPPPLPQTRRCRVRLLPLLRP